MPVLLNALLACLLPVMPPSTAPVPNARVERTGFYHSTTVGTRLVYEYGGTELVEVITSVQQKAGVEVVSVDTLCEGKKLCNVKVAVSSKGIAQLESNGKQMNPAGNMLKTGLKTGDVWEVDHTKTEWEFRATYTVCDPQVIEVPAGRYQCVCVEQVFHSGNFDQRSKRWVAPGVGLVKEVIKAENGEWKVSKVLKAVKPASK